MVERSTKLPASSSIRLVTPDGRESDRMVLDPADELEELLARSSATLRALVESVQAGVLVESVESRIMLANEAFCGMLDLDEEPEALVGWEAEMVFSALRERFADPGSMLARTRDLVERNEEALSEEVPLVDGRTLERDYIPIRLHGEERGHFWIFRDITSHKRVAEGLKHTGDRLRALSEITARLDLGDPEDLGVALARVSALLGLELGWVARLEGDESVVVQAHPVDGPMGPGARRPVDRCLASAALDEEGAATVQVAPTEADGEPISSTLISVPVHVSGATWGFVAFAGAESSGPGRLETDRDLVQLLALGIGKSVERRQAEEALRLSEARYRDFVENTSALVCIHDLQGRVLEVNHAVLETLGIERPGQIEGRGLDEFLDRDERERFAAYLETIAREEHVKGRMRVVDSAGRVRVLSFDNSLRREGVDRPVVRGLGQDVTEQVRVQELLERRVELEEVLVEISTRFLNLSPADVDRTIEATLGELGRAIGVDRCVVFLLDEPRRSLVRRYSWFRETSDEESFPEAILVEDGPELVQKVARLEAVRLESLDDLPESSDIARRRMEEADVRSLLMVPITSRGRLLGTIDLTTRRHERQWRDEIVAVVRVTGGIIGSALDQKVSVEALTRTHRELERSNRELAWNNERMALLGELGDLLQSSSDMEEAREVIRQLAPRICPGGSGAVYLYDATGGALSAVITWGGQEDLDAAIDPGSCWALRRGRPYRVDPDRSGPFCKHVARTQGDGSVCIPLLAQGEGVGVLHLRELSRGGPLGWTPGAEQLALNAAEHMALGLSNLSLRERLEAQALRDPLTGLLNRRSLEESFDHEVERARRRGSPLSVLMLDLDHFKRVNDSHGHEAGDHVLAAVADLLTTKVRAEDLVARYGGEEFTVILMDADLTTARGVAENLRQAVERLRVQVRGVSLEDLTVSIGIASLPDCGDTVDNLLAAADEALYRAKDEGRNRVATASVRPRTPDCA